MKGFKNRDYNWLYFNERVLQEAEDPTVPLLERLKFLAIFSSNLDEFFKVRVSQMRQVKDIDKELRKKLALKGSKQLQKILEKIQFQQERFGNTIEATLLELKKVGIKLKNETELSEEQIYFVKQFFEGELKDEIEILPANPEELKDGGLYLVVERPERLALLPIPIKSLGRFLVLPSKQHEVIFMDDVLRLCLPLIFPGEFIERAYSVKLSRDAELYLDDDYTDAALVEKIHNSLDKRKSGQPTRFLHDRNTPPEIIQELSAQLELGEADLVKGGRYHNISDFFGFPQPKSTDGLLYPELPPLDHPNLPLDESLFAHLLGRDELIHFPYQRFDHLEALIRQASIDPEVESIKMTLYRIAKSSALTDALLQAIATGKKVVLFVEAQARFDEENNIRWGKRFAEAGAEVIFSVPQIKVHSKIALVTRIVQGQIQRLGYIGTGNFNAKTARLYCDHGLFTSHEGITKDLEQVFLLLQKKLLFPKVKHLLVSPYSTRFRLLELIRFEADEAEAGRPSGITLKMNSLEDSVMIEALQKAAEKGVPVRLLIRGFSCLKQKKKSELLPGEQPIVVTSIIDRFLEHGRIYHFQHAGKDKVFMGSADFMTRNLDRRIEVLTPIYQAVIKNELLDILDIQIQDNVKARILDREDSNDYYRSSKGTAIRSQLEIYEYLKTKSSE